MLIAVPDVRMPSIFLSHGAPPLADDPVWTEELAHLAGSLPKPSSILVISAHWEAAPVTVGAIETVPLYYDFYGFPERYYRGEYPAPGAPRLAADVQAMLQRPGQPIAHAPDRGLDHGAYVPLVEMYPDADVPVLQISMPSLDPDDLFEIGARLAPLRKEGVLIIGSGFSTHNLREMDPTGERVPLWSSEFDHWLRETVERGAVDELMGFSDGAPAPHLAHPTTEHFAPLFVALGAAHDEIDDAESVIDGFWWGLSKRSIRFGHVA